MQLQMLLRPFALIAFAAALVVRLDAPAGAAAIPGPLGQLQSQLAVLLTRAPGHVGLIVKDLNTGLSTGINESANMPAASTIKIPVMVEVFRQMALGAFDLNRQLTLEPSDRDWGWGDLASARGGSRYTVGHLLQLMITESDNTATNMLIRFVGRVHINQTMERLGLHQTRLADYIRSDGDIRGLRTSALDMTALLDAMAHERLIDAWSSRAMIAILTGQHHNGLLPEPLPAGIAIAHKTGTLHDTLNDVGIVYLNSEPYIIAVLTTHLPTLDAGRRFIRGVSLLAYDALEKFASWREENPLSGLPAPATAPDDGDSPDVQMWTPASPPSPAAPAAMPAPALPAPAVNGASSAQDPSAQDPSAQDPSAQNQPAQVPDSPAVPQPAAP